MPDLLKASAPYALEPSELSAFRNLLLFQNTDISTRPLSTDDIGSFFSWIDRLSSCYNGAVNARHKGYYDRLFAALCKEDTPAIYLANQYYLFVWSTYQAVGNLSYYGHYNIKYWHIYRKGYAFNRFLVNITIEPGFTLPVAPDVWIRSIDSINNAWSDNPPARFILDRPELSNPIDEGKKKLVSFPAVTGQIADLWKQQWNDLMSMRDQPDLDNRSFFFLLHLLIGLGSSNDEAIRDYVHRLSITRTPTIDIYPNEVFINQLTYLALMYLGDANEPQSKYCLSHDERNDLFRQLQFITAAPHPGSQAIQKSISRQLLAMHTLSDYPLLDPESNLPLSDRKSMTRQALFMTLKKVPVESPYSMNRLQSGAPGTHTDEERAALEEVLNSMVYP